MAYPKEYISISTYDNHPNEQFMPLYLEHALYGSAWVCRTCIIGPSQRRYFTKVRYQLPNDSFYRYQGFYQNLLINTGYSGTWFPFDGIVCAIDPETDTIIKNKIEHVSKTFSAQNIERHTDGDDVSLTPHTDNGLATVASWFGTPLFVIISMHMKLLNPTREKSLWSNSKNCSIIMKLLGSKILCKNQLIAPEYTFIFLKFPKLKTIEMINRFVATSLSRNWLYNLPSTLSSFENEYNMHAFFLIDLNGILDKKNFEMPSISTKSRIITTGHIDLPNGKTIVPEYILYTDPLQWKIKNAIMDKYIEKTKWGIYSVPKSQSRGTPDDMMYSRQISRKRSSDKSLKHPRSKSKKGRNILSTIIQDTHQRQSIISSSTKS